ncbi:hypothetical protein J437_LFUL017916 [Ladona fulva]|uniref:SET domain-containing protein n=1 Tax=Ladona fulva TaxID=123851 RepID=A0A8K0KNH2_LADFU|nr:hypothetical protein J437_LFUL017916 [Ladona fulva]
MTIAINLTDVVLIMFVAFAFVVDVLVAVVIHVVLVVDAVVPKSGSNKSNKQKNRKNLEKRSGNEENEVGVDDDRKTEEIDEKEKYEQIDQGFRILTSEIMGRYLVADKDFRAGEMILDEEAIVVGPCQGSKPVCLVCYRALYSKDKFSDTIPATVPCKKCGWPLCGVESCIRARNDPNDHSNECKAFEAARKDATFSQDPLIQYSLYEAIVPLRVLLYKKHSAKRWQEICRMESHDEIRKNRPIIWNTNQDKAVNVIRDTWGLKEDFSEEEIHRVCGVLEVNAFEIGRNGSSLRGLFGPFTYLMAHDCVPNTSHVDVLQPINKNKLRKYSDEDTGTIRVQVRASSAISKGEAFYLSYAYTMQGTMARRKHLYESKFFKCACRRCSDPTELGTYMSALKCPLCEKDGVIGRVLSTNPLDEDAEWKCDKCGKYVALSSTVSSVIERVNEEAEKLPSDDVEACENFLQRYRNVLCPSHYLCIGVKHTLSQVYGKIDGYTINELPTSLLERKRELCQELIKIFDIIEPGKSRLRGITLYELHAPLMTMIMRDLGEGRIHPKRDKKELKQRLLEVCKYLEESREILVCEPSTSSEYATAIAAGEGRMDNRVYLKIKP